METRLYVGNLATETTEQDLRTMFSEVGTVSEVNVVIDRKTGKSRGFAFVTMPDPAEAEKAVNLLNAKDVHSHTLKVNISLPREDRPVETSNKP